MIRIQTMVALVALASFAVLGTAQAGVSDPQNHEIKLKLKGAGQGEKKGDDKIESGKVKDKDVTELCEPDAENPKQLKLVLVIDCDSFSNEIQIADTSTSPATFVDLIGEIDFDEGALITEKKGVPKELLATGNVQIDCGAVAANLAAAFSVKLDASGEGICPVTGKTTSVVGPAFALGEDLIVTDGDIKIEKPKDLGLVFED